ncbi:MAG: TonB-dependent receptor plug domain-containing protein [Opitutales bacterium]
MKPSITKCFRAPVLGLALLPAFLAGQSDVSADDEEIIELNPFEVATDDESGYRATSTLAGTRVRTDLRDIASAVSVVTDQFLQDTGATDQQSLLVYTTNTEVGGVYGNYSGVGGASTYSENANLLRPSNNTRVRGLDAADNTRDFFLTEIPWDNYNVDRVEMQRGPNSMLFGVGSPAGIINTTVKTAIFDNLGEFEFRTGSFGTNRASLDINRVVLEDLLSVRVAGLYERTRFRQDPAYEKDERIFGAIRYEPKLFGDGASTTFRLNLESGSITANRPRSLPPIDAITPWFMTGETNGIPNMNKLTLDPRTTWAQYGENWQGTGGQYPWFREAFMGRMFNTNMGFYLDANSTEPIRVMTPNISVPFGIGPEGTIDGTIDAIPFARPWGIATFNNYARGALPGGQYYSNVSVSDPTIFDFYDKLIDGPNKEEWQDWTTANASLAQTFLGNRVGFELVYFNQRYDDGQYAFLNGDQYMLSVDINTHLIDGRPNPQVGRPFVANSGQYGSNENFIDRDSYRGTAYGEFDFADVLEESWLTRMLGRHVLTGLVSKDVKETDNRNFARWASDPAFTAYAGLDQSIINGLRQLDWVSYLGPSLLSASTAAGANLSNVTTAFEPPRSTSIRFFDSRWNASNVAPDAPFSYNIYNSAGEAELVDDSTQSENPANYVGWTSGTFDILSVHRGDIDQLYTQVSQSKNTIRSEGITLQSYLFEGAVVATYGWRNDEVENTSQQGAKREYNVADPFNADPESINTNIAEGESRTWGVVVHTPDFLRERMPLNTALSLFYNSGENFKADAPRGDVFGQTIPNPRGETEDYGFVLSTLEDRLTVKVTWYETTVANASLGADSAGFSSNLYYVWALPYWGATHALAALDGIADPQLRQGNWGWPWNGIATMPDPANPDGDPIPDPDRIYEIVEDFFTSFPLDQSFADEYGLGLNVDAMRAGNSPEDWYASVPTYGLNGAGEYDPVNGNGASGLGLQPAFAGNLRSFGTGPVASVDTRSKGVEVEINAQITPNWNVAINFSKTESSRIAISPTIDEWIQTYTEFLEGDAGLIRIWGGDTARRTWANNILAPYSVLKAQIGSPAPEISPWRFNLVTNYSFNEGVLNGVNLGLAYRWEDKRILGYQYDPSTDTLDIDRPWHGPTEDHFDLWVGYGRDLTDEIHWRVQLNLRNVGEKVGLTPVNIQPDGTVALSRIQEGMTWTLSNTFQF